MGTFAIIFIIICLIGGVMSRSRGTVILEDNPSTKRQVNSMLFNETIYKDLPYEIRSLIERKQYFELAQLLVKLEMEGNNNLVNRLIDAIKYKSPEISIKVEDIRQNLRYRNNLN